MRNHNTTKPNLTITSGVEGEAGRTEAGEGSLGVDASAAAATQTRVQLTLVDIRAYLAVHLHRNQNEKSFKDKQIFHSYVFNSSYNYRCVSLNGNIF
jgi:hypothetical protein